MENEYPVLYKAEPVGKALITRQGMTYLITCKIQLSQGKDYRLRMESGNTAIDLGKCFQEGAYHRLARRISMKVIGDGPLNFLVSACETPMKECFYPVDIQAPFAHLDKIKHSRFAVRDSRAGILIC